MPIAACSVALALIVSASGEAAGGKSAAVARLARAETEGCLGTCPELPANVTSDWLRSPEGRKVNACPMTCRMEQPATALFRDLAELSTGPRPDAEPALVKAAGKDGPELVRRLGSALREADGQRLGPLCGRARATLRPADEATYLACVGRAPAADGGMTAPAAGRAARCAAAFAERELEWVRRCGGMEAQGDVDACVEQAQGTRRQPQPGVRERCEAETVERMVRAMSRRTRT